LATVPALLAVPGSPGLVFAVHNRFGVGKVFFDSNHGSTWSDDTQNLPLIGNDDFPAWSLAFNSPAPFVGDLYLGTDIGVYRSSAPGPNWNTVGRLSLPDVRVTALELNAALNVLDAGTYGRGVFQIPLNAITPLIASGQQRQPWQDGLPLSSTAIHGPVSASSPGTAQWSNFFSARALTPAAGKIVAAGLPVAMPAGLQPTARAAPEGAAGFSPQRVPRALDPLPLHGVDVATLDAVFAANRADYGVAVSGTERAASARIDRGTSEVVLSDVLLLAAVLSPPLTA
jgi:hypothetical protein